MPYALNLLSTVITELGNSGKDISDERKMALQKQFAGNLPDIAYNCLILLRTPPEHEYTNQTQVSMPKIGMVRVKAMTLLKTLLVAVSKIKTDQSLISHLLKIKVIDTMLYVIKTYPFCCLAH